MPEDHRATYAHHRALAHTRLQEIADERRQIDQQVEQSRAAISDSREVLEDADRLLASSAWSPPRTVRTPSVP